LKSKLIISVYRKEKEPEWKLYCNLVENPELLTSEHWLTVDGFGTMRLPEKEEVFEEFDGYNGYLAKNLVLLVSLPLIMRGHGIRVEITD
jgi:hypothetical protein